MERNEVFFDYLRAKLFEVEDNDNRVEQLTNSVNDLAEMLVDKLHEVRCYTLAALDADIPVNNPLIVATNEIVKKHWKGLEGKYPEPPRGILRGVMLSALYQLGTTDDELCRIIYYTASGHSQFVRFGNEEPVVDRILSEFGKNVEDEAVKEWSLTSTPATSKIDTFKLKGLKLGAVEVDSDTLKDSLNKAAGIEPKTNHGPQHGPQYWGPHFASTASAGITKAIETAVKSFGESISMKAVEDEINKFFSSVRTSLNTTLKDSFQSLLAVEQRSKLLWWKETLFSTTLRKGYREIDVAVLPVVMAIDLAKLLPNATPVSVDYLLTDTYLAIVGTKPQKHTLIELLEPFGEEQWQKILAPHLSMMTDCGERTTLTAFLAQVVHNQRQPKKLAIYTGLRAESQASPDQLAVIVLHDLLTERLIKEANAPQV